MRDLNMHINWSYLIVLAFCSLVVFGVIGLCERLEDGPMRMGKFKCEACKRVRVGKCEWHGKVKV